MILDTYNCYYFAWRGSNPFKKLLHDLDYYKIWLRHAVEIAKHEYWRVWIDDEGYFNHKAKGFGLSHYGDRDIGFAHSAELESGWDFTSRFYNRCNEFLPIDLNVYLYKYERDFAKISAILGDFVEQKYWIELSEKRKQEINDLLWNKEEGFFFDYASNNKRQSDFLSLAGFTPLWAGLASREQAALMVKRLKNFETDNGLVISAKESLAPRISLSKIPIRFRPAIEEVLKPKQWDYQTSGPHLNI